MKQSFSYFQGGHFRYSHTNQPMHLFSTPPWNSCTGKVFLKDHYKTISHFFYIINEERKLCKICITSIYFIQNNLLTIRAQFISTTFSNSNILDSTIHSTHAYEECSQKFYIQLLSIAVKNNMSLYIKLNGNKLFSYGYFIIELIEMTLKYFSFLFLLEN